MGRNFLLLIALLATLVMLGTWDNRRQMQRALEDGYPTTAQITGAQSLPVVTADGWRPRFVEQSLAVDLEWKGKDGQPRNFRNVPVSAGFERSIVSGNQVRLMPVPVKVLDDESVVPVITSDASARLASLQSWLAASGYAALAAWAGFAALTLLGARGRRTITAMPARPLPPRRTFYGLGLLVVGGFLAFSAWSWGRSADAIAVGAEQITADILQATETRSGYAVRLGWSDGTGVHHYGPIPVSEAFWNKITRNGQLTVHQTAIRYRGDDPAARPQIVDDAPETHWPVRVAMGAGLLLVMVGAALFASGLRVQRK
ncbi:MAG: hypothetical protein JSS04_00060 [Proteobacteria bacterium]|nr:hypothetical protein [Pseudomonadota bacterium]